MGSCCGYLNAKSKQDDHKIKIEIDELFEEQENGQKKAEKPSPDLNSNFLSTDQIKQNIREGQQKRSVLKPPSFIITADENNFIPDTDKLNIVQNQEKKPSMIKQKSQQENEQIYNQSFKQSSIIQSPTNNFTQQLSVQENNIFNKQKSMDKQKSFEVNQQLQQKTLELEKNMSIKEKEITDISDIKLQEQIENQEGNQSTSDMQIQQKKISSMVQQESLKQQTSLDKKSKEQERESKHNKNHHKSSNHHKNAEKQSSQVEENNENNINNKVTEKSEKEKPSKIEKQSTVTGNGNQIEKKKPFKLDMSKDKSENLEKDAQSEMVRRKTTKKNKLSRKNSNKTNKSSRDLKNELNDDEKSVKSILRQKDLIGSQQRKDLQKQQTPNDKKKVKWNGLKDGKKSRFSQV